MINKRITQGIYKIRKPYKQVKLSFGTLALVFAGIMLLVISAFTQIKFSFSQPYPSLPPVINFEYIPQIPAVIFIAALLGRTWGVITVLLYVILGFTPEFPIFGLGGGLSYIFQYTFGYIFAFVFSAFFTANELKYEHSFWHTVTAVLIGVFIIHISGMLYMTVTALLRQDSWPFISDLLYYQSLSKIFYDFIFSFAAVIAAKILKKALWIITG